MMIESVAKVEILLLLIAQLLNVAMNTDPKQDREAKIAQYGA
jgi:hypothetical protein